MGDRVTGFPSLLEIYRNKIGENIDAVGLEPELNYRIRAEKVFLGEPHISEAKLLGAFMSLDAFSGLRRTSRSTSFV